MKKGHRSDPIQSSHSKSISISKQRIRTRRSKRTISICWIRVLGIGHLGIEAKAAIVPALRGKDEAGGDRRNPLWACRRGGEKHEFEQLTHHSQRRRRDETRRRGASTDFCTSFVFFFFYFCVCFVVFGSRVRVLIYRNRKKFVTDIMFEVDRSVLSPDS